MAKEFGGLGRGRKGIAGKDRPGQNGAGRHLEIFARDGERVQARSSADTLWSIRWVDRMGG